MNGAVRLVLLAAVPAAIGLAMVADDLIPAALQAASTTIDLLIQILAVQIPLAAMDTILAMALIAATGSAGTSACPGAAILNPIACVVLIHWADGRTATARSARRS